MSSTERSQAGSRLWPPATIWCDGRQEVGVGLQPDDVDPRNHDLVNAALAELDDRVDHLLLLGLQDALVAAALDDELELLRGDLGAARDVRPERPDEEPGEPREQPHEGRQETPEEVDRPRQQERGPVRVGQGERLGHELADDDREERDEARHDHEGDRVGAPLERGNAADELGQAAGEGDRGDRGRQEADERDRDLDDRQEPARILDEAADAGRAPAALVDELVHAAAADRHQGDLGGDEDPRRAGSGRRR